MRNTGIKMILGYLIISFLVFFLYRGQMSSSKKTVVVWNEVEQNPVIQDEPVSTQVPTQVVFPEVTQKPIQTVTSEVIQSNPTATPTITPTITPTVTPTITKGPALEATPKISEDIVGPNTEKVTVKFDGKEIGYRSTSYRMSEETLEKIVSMVCKEPYVSSFILYDIYSEATISYNEERYYPVASTVKGPFAMTCLWQIEEGLCSLNDTLEDTENKGSGEGMNYTIKELIENTIVRSDNKGYYMLQEHFGYDYYNQFLLGLGNRVTIGDGIKWGKTSAIDSLKNWKEIYAYITSDRENACFFADLLKRTNKGYIRNVIGKEYEVYNKMGWVSNQCCHDHAIVMDEEPYILIIMTMGDVGKDNQRFMENLAIILNEVHEEMVEDF